MNALTAACGATSGGGALVDLGARVLEHTPSLPCGYLACPPFSRRPPYLFLTLYLAVILRTPLPFPPVPPHLVFPQGIHWQEADVLVAVSDRMKAEGKQPFVCQEHDQSIHTFLVPR